MKKKSIYCISFRYKITIWLYLFYNEKELSYLNLYNSRSLACQASFVWEQTGVPGENSRDQAGTQMTFVRSLYTTR